MSSNKHSSKKVDEILYDSPTKEQKKILFSPRTGTEMQDAMQGQAPIYEYSDLCEIASQCGNGGAQLLLGKMFNKSDKNIILLQDPDNMNSGHWISVSRDRPNKAIYFFSSYGGRPDVEKIQWISKAKLRRSGQLLNIFNDSLRACQEQGWTIHYNDEPYQVDGDNTATCGIFTVAFLRSGLNPEEFKIATRKLKRQSLNPAIVYYNKYFA